ncbi:MAG: hypothetical protein ACR2Q4_04735 [Geminicoccaceae bacterium]
MPVFFESLLSKLQDKGLYILGKFPVDADETVLPDAPAQPAEIAIVGNVGSSIWSTFEAQRRQQPDLTLDRWTKETIDGIFGPLGIRTLYPFEGPPYWPFTQWAKRTGNLFSSPIGITIHPTYGLWHAFRAALLFERSSDFDDCPRSESENPCDTCADRPCLNTCPVAAFSERGYDFGACLDHIATPSNACRQGACLARAACPIGRQYHYEQEHAAFHMHELLKAHGKA